MFLPESHTAAVMMMVITMLCWGSWANTQKLAGNFRFELFYWDYVFSIVLTSFVFLFTLGGETAAIFEYGLPLNHFISAALGGVVFNIGNFLLVAAIALAGMAVAFPVGIGIALLMGTGLNYLVKPQGSISWLIIGVALVLAAVIFDAIAYRKISTQGASRKGLIVAITAGILIGLFYPLVARAMEGDGALNPYQAMACFCIGVLVCNIPFNAYLMRRPLAGTPVTIHGYFKATFKQHAWAWVGGIIWCTGMMLNLIAAKAAGPAVAYAFGQGATLVAAIWGVFVWREFKGAKGTNVWLTLMFIFYILGLFAIHEASSLKYTGQPGIWLDFENSYLGQKD